MKTKNKRKKIQINKRIKKFDNKIFFKKMLSSPPKYPHPPFPATIFDAMLPQLTTIPHVTLPYLPKILDSDILIPSRSVVILSG